MEYLDFVEEIKKLYKKYFGEDGVKSVYDDNKEIIKPIWDPIFFKSPKGLKIEGAFLNIVVNKKDFDEYGISSPLTIDTEMFSHLDDGNRKYSVDDIVSFKMKGRYKHELILKKVDEFFKKSSELLRNKTASKFVRVTKKI